MPAHSGLTDDQHDLRLSLEEQATRCCLVFIAHRVPCSQVPRWPTRVSSSLAHPRRVAFILECLRVYEGYWYLFNYGELLMT